MDIPLYTILPSSLTFRFFFSLAVNRFFPHIICSDWEISCVCIKCPQANYLCLPMADIFSSARISLLDGAHSSCDPPSICSSLWTLALYSILLPLYFCVLPSTAQCLCGSALKFQQISKWISYISNHFRLQ